jgi:DNA-binding IclR family transcriptional regulator
MRNAAPAGCRGRPRPIEAMSMRRPPVKSAVRVIEIFEHFAEARRSLALKDIVDHLGYPQSSTTNLLKSLVSMGYLHYDRVERTYYPTFRVTSLGDWFLDVIDDDLLELMHRLQAKTTETILLATQNDLYLQYLKVLDSRHELRFYIKEGSMRPLTQSSLGWVLLGQMPPSALDKLCRHINVIESQASRRVPLPAFLKDIEKVRKQGHCYVPNMPELGGGSVAMVLPGTIGGQRMAIGVGGLCVRLEKTLEKIIAEMRRAVADYAVQRGRKQATAS